MAKVEKSMIISELIQLDENLIYILMREGMHCVGCPSAQMETLEEAAYVHGMDPDVLVARLNEFLGAVEADKQ
jgi:hybrid cluster-associated redox disulfide protein